MNAIQQVRSALRSHPLLAVSVVAVAFVSLGAAFVVGAAAIGCLVGPRLIEKHAPEVAVEDAVTAARRHGLRMIQRASAVKADEIGLRRMLDGELMRAGASGSDEGRANGSAPRVPKTTGRYTKGRGARSARADCA